MRLREAQAEGARLAFERTLLEALGEVETAAEGVVRTRERVERLDQAARSASSSVELARALYESGTRSLLQLLDTQRAQVAVQDDLLERAPGGPGTDHRPVPGAGGRLGVPGP